ncbi:MAG: hypothetical protein CML13_04950 [Puniceicoccaceae bacterium]|jgi:hypothetical protein|nr:hypothetical protein [Puniceicoccaceae bacterium]|tara:strand:+ start:6548 stop:7126 length:579 start_codon:yes stop_codon:yes gene_type:complete
MIQKHIFAVKMIMFSFLLTCITAGCSSTDLKRFVPSVANLEKEGYNLQVVIRGEQQQEHLPFLFMRNVEKGPYVMYLSLTTKNSRAERVEIKDATISIEDAVYSLEPEESIFELDPKTYTSSGNGGLQTNQLNEGKNSFRFSHNMPYQIDSDYYVSLTLMIHPSSRQLVFKQKFSFKRIEENKSITETYKDI